MNIGELRWPRWRLAFRLQRWLRPPSARTPSLPATTCSTSSAASDPQISPDGRWIAYVRRSNDIMTDRARSSIWLIDAASGDQRRWSPAPAIICSPRWSPDGKRLAYVSTAEGGAPQLFVRWMDSGQTRAHHRPARQPAGHRLVARRTAHRLSDERPRRGRQARLGPDQARRRRMGQAARGHRQGHLPRRRRRLSEAGLRPYLRGRCARRRAAPADLRRLSRRQIREWTPDGRAILFSAVRKPDWEMIANDSEVYRLDVASGAVDRADRPPRPRCRADRFARRPADRLCRLRRSQEGLRAGATSM